jgi:hypothetical protein
MQFNENNKKCCTYQKNYKSALNTWCNRPCCAHKISSLKQGVNKQLENVVYPAVQT